MGATPSGPARCWPARWPPGESHLEARVLEVEVALDAAHDLVVDLAHVAQADDLGALGLEHLAAQALVGLGLPVDRAVVVLVEARREAPDAEVVEAAHAVGGVVADPVLFAQLLDPVERGAGREDPRLGLALLEIAVVFHA